MIDRIFDQNALFFTVPALLGTGIFVLRLGMMLAGGVADIDVDTEADLDFDGPGEIGVDADTDLDSGESSSAFRALGIQSISAFAMGFGTAGLAALIGFDQSLPASTLMAIGFGVLMVWLFGLGMKMVHDLQSSGNIEAQDTVGLEGVVDTNVPAQGSGCGRIRLVVDERLRHFDAVSTGDALPTSTRIRVVSTSGDHALVIAAV